MSRRPYGTGSLFQMPDGSWVFSKSLTINGQRRRPTCSGPTEASVLAKAAIRESQGWLSPRERSRRRVAAEARQAELQAIEARSAISAIHANDYAVGLERRQRAIEYVSRVMAIARSESWSDEWTARVIIAALTPNRVRRGIFGPCAYCGTWFATEVDHIIPQARGGTDDPDNLASACKSCNARKRTRTPEEWVA